MDMMEVHVELFQDKKNAKLQLDIILITQTNDEYG